MNNWYALLVGSCLLAGTVDAQPQLCLFDDGQIGGYWGADGGPFAFGGCMVPIDADTSVWKIWPGSVEQEWSDICPAFEIPILAMLETVMPYPVATLDTFTIKHVCNVFDTRALAERLALANSNELAGLSDQVLDGTEKLLLTVMYYDLCHELDTLQDAVTTRLSVDRGATWIEVADASNPFSTEATAMVCPGWTNSNLFNSVAAPASWTGNGYAWYSRHVFDLFQGYRSVWPQYTDADEYLNAWNVNEMDTVIQQFILQSDNMPSGNRGWRLPGMFVTSFHVRDSGLGLMLESAEQEWPEVRYAPLPVLFAPETNKPIGVHVYDVTGRIVQHDVLPPHQSLPLVPGAPPGFYLVRFTLLGGRQWATSFINP